MAGGSHEGAVGVGMQSASTAQSGAGVNTALARTLAPTPVVPANGGEHWKSSLGPRWDPSVCTQRPQAGRGASPVVMLVTVRRHPEPRPPDERPERPLVYPRVPSAIWNRALSPGFGPGLCSLEGPLHLAGKSPRPSGGPWGLGT